MSSDTPEIVRPPLTGRERRVLGVLVEKAKTTPDVYPLTINALLTGCNQKSNRDPITNYDSDDVEDILGSLRKKGAVVMVEGGGRVVRWKHTLYEWLKVSKVELAVLAELMLRGAQSEGDLRARASRMEPLGDLTVLQGILDALRARGLVIRLSPEGQQRGVVVTHGLYSPDELLKVRQAFALRPVSADDDEPRPAARTELAATGPPAWVAEIASLRDEVLAWKAEITSLKLKVETLEAEVHELKSALGA